MAKIPIILEPGRADGKLVSSDAIFDENKGMFQSEINDIQDTLNSDNPNKPLSAKQGKVLKELLNSKVIEVGAVPIDTEPTEGNTTHIVNSDGLAKEFNKCNTTIINTDRIANEAIIHSKLSVDIQNLITNLNKTATFAGIATPTTDPGTPNGPVFYIATTAGNYSNFGNIEISKGESAILKWNNSIWIKNIFQTITVNSYESNDDNSDLDVSDENGNVILRLKNGHLYVQKFSSDNTLSTENLQIRTELSDDETSNRKLRLFLIGYNSQGEPQEYGPYSLPYATEKSEGTMSAEDKRHLEKLNTSDTQDADFDLADDNGNVIIRCNEGNIKTKNFNSANIEETNLSPILKSKINNGNGGSKDLSVQTYNEGTADFYLSDDNGNVLLELEGGNIKTKNFYSSSSTANKKVGFIPDILLKYHAIGDSITAGTGTSIDNRYFELLKPWCKFTSITSDGVGGRELQSFKECLSNIPSTTELVSFFGGTNDWGHHKQLGTINSIVGASNFYGQVKYLCDWMQKNKPNVRFFFICPLKRDNSKFPADGCPKGQDTNNLGKKLDDYVNAIKEVCEIYKVPYIDLFSGKNSFDFTNYMGDGLHPSADGHSLLAFQIQKLINYKL